MGFVPAKQTTIIAGQRLWTRIAEYDVLLSDLKRSQSGEVIILKRIKDGYWDNGEKIDYEDTTITHDYRQEIASINWWLSEADIDFDEHYDRDDQRVDYTDRYLRRYFCNSSFEQGREGLWWLLAGVVKANKKRRNPDKWGGSSLARLRPDGPTNSLWSGGCATHPRRRISHPWLGRLQAWHQEGVQRSPLQ